MIALRPRDRHVWDPRPVPYETEAETETKKWSRDHVGLETLTSLASTLYVGMLYDTMTFESLDVRVVFVWDARDFPRHWFPSSTPLIRNLPSQPGKTTFPVTGLEWPKRD